MKLSTLQLYLLLALFSLMFTSVWSYNSFLKIEQENERILTEAIPISNAAARLFPLLLDQELTVRSYLLDQNDQTFKQFKDTNAELKETITTLKMLDQRHPIMKQLLAEEAIPLIQRTDGFYEQQIRWIRDNQVERATLKRYSGMDYVNQFRPINTKIRQDIDNIIKEATDRSKAASASAKWVIVIVVSVAVLLLFAFLQTFRLERSKQALIHRSLHDALTGIPNRRAFDEHLETSFTSAKEAKTDVALILIDVDEFKRYNDTYGHLKGDWCLQKVAGTLKKHAGDFGLVSRYGGEEFAVILTEQADQASHVAERIRSEILQLNIEHATYQPLCRVSVSIGLAVVQPTERMQEGDLIVLADQALYRAKSSGRNQISSHEAS
ncbi:diguanylate cyclase domain-containing protein [Exiguobacterium undae]|uniref:sensor domain-containing diguanylate cyclase n=1 Tax=Exiguobacterium undae TaxID=169177 RepID=UPI00047E77C3|nr:diguanylate cyclase [Exiguobacterium undae]